MAHLLDCATVRAALATVARDAHVPAPEWSLADVFLQRRMDGDRRSLMLASLAAVWSARRLASSGWDLRDPARLAEIVGREVRCPWLVACSATLCKKERRRARARKRPPDPRAVYYRFDGASRAQGIGGAGVAGWGAAVWPAGSGGEGAPAATVTGFLGRGVSNNISEYSGLRACLERAVRDTASNHPMHPVIFQGDSKLVMQQAAGECACRSPSLGELFDACRGLLRTLRARGSKCGFSISSGNSIPLLMDSQMRPWTRRRIAGRGRDGDCGGRWHGAASSLVRREVVAERGSRRRRKRWRPPPPALMDRHRRGWLP